MFLAAGVVGYFGDKGYGKTAISSLPPIIIGSIIIFFLGVGYLSTLIGFDSAIKAGLLPFIPSEFFKIGLAACTIHILRKFLDKNIN